MTEKHRTTEHPETRLAPLREQINAYDRQIVELLNERAKVVVQIGKIKQDTESAIYAPAREQQVLEQVRQWNKGPLSDACLEAIWRELMSGSFALERPQQVGYLGPRGSFSHLAARRKFGSDVQYQHMDDIAGVFDAVARGRTDLGLVPIENSVIGGIAESLDSFLDSTVRVIAEVLISIHHHVLANAPLDQITRVYSKPEVFNQCRRWLSEHLRGAERVPVASSSRAAELASQDPDAAAIGSSLAGEIYGLQTRFANVEDNPGNITRFFVISTQRARASGDDKTAVMFTTAPKPGALADVLQVFRDYGLNLTHLDKRPTKRVNWEYFFFVDFLGHESDENVAGAIKEASARCLHLSVLGSFPRAREVL